MRFGRVFGFVVFSGLLAANAALAGNATESAGVKANHALPKNSAAIVRHVKPQAPIVMGRSVSAIHHKSKLHHVKVKAAEPGEKLGSAENPR